MVFSSSFLYGAIEYREIHIFAQSINQATSMERKDVYMWQVLLTWHIELELKVDRCNLTWKKQKQSVSNQNCTTLSIIFIRLKNHVIISTCIAGDIPVDITVIYFAFVLLLLIRQMTDLPLDIVSDN